MFPKLSFSQLQTPKATHCVCLLCVFTLPLVCCDGLPKHTHSVCECSVPRTSTSCVWVFSRHENTDDSVLGCQPLFSSLFVFFSPLFMFSLFSFLFYFSLLSPFLPSTHQHLTPLLPLSVLSIDSPSAPCGIHHRKHTPAFSFLVHNEVLCASASVCLVCCVPSTLSP